MVKLRLHDDFARRFDLDSPFELDCTGSTLHACIDEACRRTDPRLGDALLEHEPGHRWHLRDDADVRVNGNPVRELEGLGTPVTAQDEIEIRG